MRIFLNAILVLAVFAAMAVAAHAQQVWINNAAPNNCAACANNANCMACQNAAFTRTLVVTHTRSPRVLIPASVCSTPATVLCTTPAVATIQCAQPAFIPATISEPPALAPAQPMPQVPMQVVPMNPPAILAPTAAPPPAYPGTPSPNVFIGSAAPPCNCTQANVLTAAPNCANTADACSAARRQRGHFVADVAQVGRDFVGFIFHPFARRRANACEGGNTTTRTRTVVINR